MSIPSEILFRSPTLIVRSRLGSQNARVIITFDSFTDDPNLDRPGFGEHFLTERGIDCIVVLSSRNDWYQNPDMASVIRSIQDHILGYERVFTYGSSMGGYAALRYAGILGATAITFGPQYSVNPKRMPEEVRWPQTGLLRFLDNDGLALTQPNGGFIFYDPRDRLDRLHVTRITREIEISLLPITYGGHVVISFLNEAGLLAPALIDILEDRFDPASFLTKAQIEKKRTPKYFEVLSHLTAHSHPNWSLALAKHAAMLSPGAGYMNHVATLLRETGRYSEAEPWARDAVRSEPANLNFRYGLAALLFGLGETDEAMALTVDLLRATPDRQDYHRLMAGILRARGAYHDAFRARIRALILSPKGSHVRRKAIAALVREGLSLLPPARRFVNRQAGPKRFT